MNFAIQLLNEGSLKCGYWHAPLGRKTEFPDDPIGQPLNAKKYPPLIFETRKEAFIAVEFYNSLYADHHIEAKAAPVAEGVEATHRATNDGFQPVPMGADTLFG